jgi:hypothetical protein
MNLKNLTDYSLLGFAFSLPSLFLDAEKKCRMKTYPEFLQKAGVLDIHFRFCF